MEGQVADPRVGLCAACGHARVVTSAKSSAFWRCGYHEQDPRFPKYPRLPVVTCAAFERGVPQGHQR